MRKPVPAQAVLRRDDARQIRDPRALAGGQEDHRAVEGHARLVLVAESMRAESEAEPRPAIGVIVEKAHAGEMLELDPALPIDQCAIDVLKRGLVPRLRLQRLGKELERLQIFETARPILRRGTNRLTIDEVRDRSRVLREGAVLHVADDGAVDVAVGDVLVLAPPRHPHLVGRARQHLRIAALPGGLQRLLEQRLGAAAHGGGVGREIESPEIDQVAR